MKLEELNKKKVSFKSQLEQNFIKNSKSNHQSLEKELKIYWKNNDWETISKMLNAKRQATKERKNFLERELGWKGNTLEWFMETFKNDIKE